MTKQQSNALKSNTSSHAILIGAIFTLLGAISLPAWVAEEKLTPLAWYITGGLFAIGLSALLIGVILRNEVEAA